MVLEGSYRLLVRMASVADSPAIAHVFTASRRALAFLPILHTPEEDRVFIETLIREKASAFVALVEDEVVGFIAMTPGWIEHLYVAPAYLRRGIGSALLRTAMAEDDELRAWTFQKNEAARAFYERHGFTALLFTNGSENEEREPDVLYRFSLSDAG
jgi:putative acetyltransferase